MRGTFIIPCFNSCGKDDICFYEKVLSVCSSACGVFAFCIKYLVLLKNLPSISGSKPFVAKAFHFGIRASVNAPLNSTWRVTRSTYAYTTKKNKLWFLKPTTASEFGNNTDGFFSKNFAVGVIFQAKFFVNHDCMPYCCFTMLKRAFEIHNRSSMTKTVK